MAHELEAINTFLQYTNELRKEYSNEPRHNLNRLEIIRTLLHQCREKSPHC